MTLQSGSKVRPEFAVHQTVRRVGGEGHAKRNLRVRMKGFKHAILAGVCRNSVNDRRLRSRNAYSPESRCGVQFPREIIVRAARELSS